MTSAGRFGRRRLGRDGQRRSALPEDAVGRASTSVAGLATKSRQAQSMCRTSWASRGRRSSFLGGLRELGGQKSPSPGKVPNVLGLLPAAGHETVYYPMSSAKVAERLGFSGSDLVDGGLYPDPTLARDPEGGVGQRRWPWPARWWGRPGCPTAAAAPATTRPPGLGQGGRR